MTFAAGAGLAGAGLAGAGVAGAGATVTSLRMQRRVLAHVAAELASSLRRIPTADGSWRSDAQRAYLRKLGELEHDLRAAWAALAAAIDEVDHAIAVVERNAAARATFGAGAY